MTAPPTGAMARAQRYLAAQPKDDGRTFHADHPDVIIAELVAEVSTRERELEEARENAEQEGFAREDWQELATSRHAELTASQAEVERLMEALGRQADNMSFILNRVGHDVLHAWWDKFDRELMEDRTALQVEERDVPTEDFQAGVDNTQGVVPIAK